MEPYRQAPPAAPADTTTRDGFLIVAAGVVAGAALITLTFARYGMLRWLDYAIFAVVFMACPFGLLRIVSDRWLRP